ncbi:MAG: hypothetical protein VSS52_003620 [Thiotrichaceae bacterium]|nr:hypothetical protein [Thiotrichaceae bacterium]
MEIKFSRHAKRRAKLYKIPQDVIIENLKSLSFLEGKHEILQDIKGFEYPIKIMIVAEKDILTIITNYPYKKGAKK